MTSSHIRSLVQSNNEEREAISGYVKKFVQDKNKPLDERWDLFVDTKLGDHCNTYHEPDGVDWGKHCLHDDFCLEKYETITAEELLDRGEDSIEDEVAFKEYFLDNYVWSFEHDW